MGFNTDLLHKGKRGGYAHGATLPEICQVTAFQFGTAEEQERIFAHEVQGAVYTRVANPTITALEDRLRAMEHGSTCIVFGSGMAAVFGVFMTLLSSGDEVIASGGIYGGSVEVLNAFENLGVHTRFVNEMTCEAIEPLINERTRLVYGEVIGNPSLFVADIEALAELAHSRGLPLVLDATTATPLLVNPIDLGCDIVVHSTSKYIDGSSNSIGGAVVDAGRFDWTEERYPALKGFLQHGKAAFAKRCRDFILDNFGGCMSPFNAYLTCMGLETLGLRMERECRTAEQLARALAGMEGVSVNYPLLEDSPSRPTALKELRGYGGAILTMRAGSKERAHRILDALRYASIVSNIGDVRTLAVYPAGTIFASGTKEEQERAGIFSDSIRVSVGLEDAEDLIADFEQAIEKA